MQILKSIMHLIVGSATLAISWMGTTALAVGVLVAPFVVRLGIAFRRGRWRAVSQTLGTASLYTLSVWVFLFVIGIVRFIYLDHTSLVKTNARLSDALRMAQTTKLVVDDKDGKKLTEELQQARYEAQHWHDAYLGISRGDMHPDRILNSEETNTLYEELRRISKDQRNRDYIKVELGCVQDREASRLASQLLQVFRQAKWNVTLVQKPTKEFQEKLNYSGPIGVTIWTADQNRGNFLAYSLKESGVEAFVNPMGIPANFKGVLLWVGYKQLP